MVMSCFFRLFQLLFYIILYILTFFLKFFQTIIHLFRFAMNKKLVQTWLAQRPQNYCVKILLALEPRPRNDHAL
ncbi:hypothetical protein GQ457_12G012660 [Hibiscus cannabinus]